MWTNKWAEKGRQAMTRNNTAGAGSILLAAIAVTAFLLAAPVADAQDSVSDDLLACDRLSAAPDRLACFNDIVRRLKAGEAAPVKDRARSPVTDSGPATSRASRPAVAEEAVPETSRPAVAAANSIPEDFGLKRKLKPEGKEQTRPVLTARVVRHWEDSLGRLVLQLDNGQVWTEVVSYNARIPKGEATVEIKPGRFGGWRMRINDNVRLVKVKRLK